MASSKPGGRDEADDPEFVAGVAAWLVSRGGGGRGGMGGGPLRKSSVLKLESRKQRKHSYFI